MKRIIYFLIAIYFFSADSYASSYVRKSLSQVVCESDKYYVCSVSKTLGDSVFFEIENSSGSKASSSPLLVVMDELSHFVPDTTQYYLVLSNKDGLNYQLFSFDKNESTKTDLLKACKKIKEIEAIENIEKRIEEYKKWTFALGKSKHDLLQREGLYEWVMGIQRYVNAYERVNNIPDRGLSFDEKIPDYGIVSEKDIRTLFSLFKKRNCIIYNEWRLCGYYFLTFCKEELSDFIYTYINRYLRTENKCYIPLNVFGYLRKAETDQTVLSMIDKLESNVSSRNNTEALENIQEIKIIRRNNE
ncbi:hypothetical protein M2451_000482 [Dysgonomonas sp. PFB1-18]|uniref:hypothetical protein n=1 Tax=unclassified Dysgonomonas TaxID=2630389 RepID=UPI002473C8F1|nr:MULTISPECIES: hypothetical protein [unclassified Dysgonomonas]MDH6307333.1 hypothetical protein [Dysgonomonas sp. PF1-14]MDH6337251.1 hypothetical protein [Dysgonomonas sp. PF1-16]MDH6379175.1 hypothetical protein [Dysgonomonas sp. PFB1-18]MDH6396187.1 hypothetical protein [Dysgonomonas sp. PF1-23]